MYKHAKAPILIGQSEKKRTVKLSSSNLSLLISSIRPSRLPPSERLERLFTVRRTLVNLGVSKYRDLPEIVFLADDPVAAYRRWCRITRIVDETQSRSTSSATLQNDLARLEEKQKIERLRVEERKVAKQLRKSQKRMQHTGADPVGEKVVKIPPVEEVTKKKKKTKKIRKHAEQDDLFTKGSRLPGSAYSK